MGDRENKLFLKALQEDGIGEIYLDPQTSSTSSHKASEPSQATLTTPQTNDKRSQLIALRNEVLPCTKCHELASSRTKVVFGAGNSQARLMFVGEAPGRDEDEQGLPFVGRAGQLLTKIIESIGLDRKQVFIANILKCRPPKNRTPAPEEVMNCKPYIQRQIEIIQPEIICCLGNIAAQNLLETAEGISRLRGKFLEKYGTRVIATYHPAYLLRNPGEKRKVWEDMKKIKKELGI